MSWGGLLETITTGIACAIAYDALKPLLKRAWARARRPSPLSTGNRVKVAATLDQQRAYLAHLVHLEKHPRDALRLYLFALGIFGAFAMAAALYVFRAALGIDPSPVLMCGLLMAVLSAAAVYESVSLSAKNIAATIARTRKTIVEAEMTLGIVPDLVRLEPVARKQTEHVLSDGLTPFDSPDSSFRSVSAGTSTDSLADGQQGLRVRTPVCAHVPEGPRAHGHEVGRAFGPEGTCAVVSTLALSSLKGGVGKSTLTLNVAACLHRAGHRTLIVDADPQATCSAWVVELRTREATGPPWWP